jgi:hypothetical protein
MHRFRRLSPFAHVAGVLGFLLILASLTLSTVSFITFWSSNLHTSADTSRTQLVSINLAMLGLVFITVLNANNTRFRQPDRQPVSPSSWQSQLRMIMLLGSLPIAALALATFISPTLGIYGLAFGMSIIAVLELVVANAWLLAPRQPIG